MRFVKVSFPKSRLEPLTYSVPEDFPSPNIGIRVQAPLGPRFATGFIVETDVASEARLEIKPVADVLDSENLFSPRILELTKWVADYYLATWADVLKAALPPALDVKPEMLITITQKGEFDSSAHAILQILHDKKTLPLKEIYKLFGHRGTFSQLKLLEEQGCIELVAGRKRKRRGYNMVEVVGASEPPAGNTERALYDYLKEQPGAVPVEDLRDRFKNVSLLLRKLAKQEKIRCFWLPSAPGSVWPELEPVSELNTAQQEAFQRIRQKQDMFSVFLLHGVTGSGKTEVYLRMAQDILAQGKSVLILVPEIALLPLFARRAEQILRYPISILHSELGDRERLEEWEKARTGKVRLVLGTRSAVFAPLRDPGLIIVDEEHDGSYKQQEYPRYHARDTAIMRARLEKCLILLGSATPSLESFYNAGNGKYEYLSLPERVEQKKMPHIQLVDMKQEYQETGDPIFSRRLLEYVTKRLHKGEQTLILQNRRGYAAWLMCRDCGNILECPHCSVTLTYHKQAHRMKCHYCDYSRLAPTQCEKCGSAILHLFGVGTEKIAERLRHLFPKAKIERFDRDVTRSRGSIAKILGRFAAKEIDILVGTQMLAKGHDFPGITLVGVIGADSAIGIPDFRSSERLYQLITQVSGRSGRGIEPGQVLLQTFHPDHYAIRCSIEQSYAGFYEKESRFRRLMQYPPYMSLANIILSGKVPAQVVAEAREFAKFILAFKTQTMRMLGPAVAPIARLSGLHRFQILVKSPSRKSLRECLQSALSHFQQQRRRSQVSIDIDPYSIV